jgi:hypothetical protein
VEEETVTAPDQPRPVPGPPRPVPGPLRAPVGQSVDPAVYPAVGPAPADASGTVPQPPAERFAGLAERPLAEHVAVFEAEHDRLQRELSTVDQL